jgi:phage terminase large subunit
MLRRDLIRPLPSQTRALDAMYDFEYILFGGAAGPGKSHILRWGAVEFLLYQAQCGHRDVRVGLFCEDYPTLKDRHVSKIKREFPEWLGELRASQDEGHGFYLRPEFGSGVVSLRNLDDPAKYASAEFAAIFVDELTKNPRQTFDDLRFRKRWPGIEHSPFMAGSNPGSIGHGWVKKLWIDHDFTGDDGNLNPSQFCFIPALPRENPYLPESYWETLNSLPEDMRRRMLEGDWSIFAGQVFAEWRHDLHVCDPFEIPADWVRLVSIDYGFAKPFCALWLARSPDKAKVYVYRELYRAGYGAREQAKRIKAASGEEKIAQYPADPSMWQKREGVRGEEVVGVTLADEYAQERMYLSPANNNRLAGLNECREMLAWKRLPGAEQRLIKPPRLQVFANCVNLIRTLPALPYDNIVVEDVDTDAEDHAYDALRYGLMALSQPAPDLPTWQWSTR